MDRDHRGTVDLQAAQVSGLPYGRLVDTLVSDHRVVSWLIHYLRQAEL